MGWADTLLICFSFVGQALVQFLENAISAGETYMVNQQQAMAWMQVSVLQ